MNKEIASNNSNSGKSSGTISESKKSSVSSFFSSNKNKAGTKSKDKEKEKVEKEKDLSQEKEVSGKSRPVSAQMPHPASFSTLYQLHQMQNGMLNGTVKNNGILKRQSSQPEPYMWHTKSYDHGIGKISNFV